jgi:hypothetical protein
MISPPVWALCSAPSLWIWAAVSCPAWTQETGNFPHTHTSTTDSDVVVRQPYIMGTHNFCENTYTTSSTSTVQHLAVQSQVQPIRSNDIIRTHVVNTLAAAFSKWKFLTLRMLSAYSVSTYNSPPFREMTSRSYEMKEAWAPSRLSFTPSCTSGKTSHKLLKGKTWLF